MNKFIVRMATVLLSFTGFLFARPASAQSIYTIHAATANIHIQGSPAAMPLGKVTGEAQFGFTEGTCKQLSRLYHFRFTIGPLAMEDSNTNNITYLLTAYTIIPQTKGGYLLITEGLLTLDNITRKTAMDIYATVNTDGSITCTGSYPSGKPTGETFGFTVTYQTSNHYL
jgi:hypothetical protein